VLLALGVDESRRRAGQLPVQSQAKPWVHVMEYLRLDGHCAVGARLDLYRFWRDLDLPGAARFLPFYVKIVRANVRLHQRNQ